MVTPKFFAGPHACEAVVMLLQTNKAYKHLMRADTRLAPAVFSQATVICAACIRLSSTTIESMGYNFFDTNIALRLYAGNGEILFHPQSRADIGKKTLCALG